MQVDTIEKYSYSQAWYTTYDMDHIVVNPATADSAGVVKFVIDAETLDAGLDVDRTLYLGFRTTGVYCNFLC